MRRTFQIFATAGCVLFAGCAFEAKAAPAGDLPIRVRNAPGVDYDDMQVARIQLGVTTEAQLVDWFGAPVNRDLRPDGRAQLDWMFSHETNAQASVAGNVSVSLTPNGTVEQYSARRSAPVSMRVVEFVEQSDADMREHMAQWDKEGWKVISFSGRLKQADGTIHRRAMLSHDYNDRLIATIKRGVTTETQLLEKFGSPDCRNVRSDGRAQLAWSFVGQKGGGSGRSGVLNVSLAPDGTVDAYSAREEPE